METYPGFDGKATPASRAIAALIACLANMVGFLLYLLVGTWAAGGWAIALGSLMVYRVVYLWGYEQRRSEKP